MIFLKKKTKLYWTDCDIPARLFFSILETGDFSEIGTAPKEELEAAFDKIFDEYVQIDNNQRVIQWYQKKTKIAVIQLTIQTLETLLYVLCYTPLDKKGREKVIDTINSLEGVKAKFKKDADVLAEVSRVQNTVLGALRNRLKIELASEKKVGEKVKYSFDKDVVGIENVLGYSMPDDMSLKKFVYRKKAAEEKARAQQKTVRHGRK